MKEGAYFSSIICEQNFKYEDDIPFEIYENNDEKFLFIPIDYFRKLYSENVDKFNIIVYELALRGANFNINNSSNLFPKVESKKSIVIKCKDNTSDKAFEKIDFKMFNIEYIINDFNIRDSKFFHNVPLAGFEIYKLDKISLRLLQNEFTNAGFKAEYFVNDGNPDFNKFIRNNQSNTKELNNYNFNDGIDNYNESKSKNVEENTKSKLVKRDIIDILKTNKFYNYLKMEDIFTEERLNMKSYNKSNLVDILIDPIILNKFSFEELEYIKNRILNFKDYQDIVIYKVIDDINSNFDIGEKSIKSLFHSEDLKTIKIYSIKYFIRRLKDYNYDKLKRIFSLEKIDNDVIYKFLKSIYEEIEFYKDNYEYQIITHEDVEKFIDAHIDKYGFITLRKISNEIKKNYNLEAKESFIQETLLNKFEIYYKSQNENGIIYLYKGKYNKLSHYLYKIILADNFKLSLQKVKNIFGLTNHDILDLYDKNLMRYDKKKQEFSVSKKNITKVIDTYKNDDNLEELINYVENELINKEYILLQDLYLNITLDKELNSKFKKYSESKIKLSNNILNNNKMFKGNNIYLSRNSFEDIDIFLNEIGNKDIYYRDEFKKLSEKIGLSEIYIINELEDSIKNNYIVPIHYEEYIKKSNFPVNDEDIKNIKKLINENIENDYISLTKLQFNLMDLPSINGIEWTPSLASHIATNYLDFIELESKNVNYNQNPHIIIPNDKLNLTIKDIIKIELELFDDNFTEEKVARHLYEKGILVKNNDSIPNKFFENKILKKDEFNRIRLYE